MPKTLIVSAVAVLAVATGATSALAFTTVTKDGYPATTLSTRLADPEDIMSDMASQQSSGGSVTISRFGGTTLGIVGPGAGYGTGVGPFVPDPAMTTVPSKREGW